MYHMLNSFSIIFRQVNDTSLCLQKRVATCSLKEG
jgi:hypothetical protein